MLNSSRKTVLIVYDTVVQLVLTYGPIHINVTTRGQLLVK